MLIAGWLLSARDTVEIDTPASFARSSSVVFMVRSPILVFEPNG
ncbi:MAG TPA: hypothetical protein VG166_04925 [Caulobacteraceae bacterium]|nr:hypothetical protein [Caulobacteraceae bacterium]